MAFESVQLMMKAMLMAEASFRKARIGVENLMPTEFAMVFELVMREA